MRGTIMTHFIPIPPVLVCITSMTYRTTSTLSLTLPCVSLNSLPSHLAVALSALVEALDASKDECTPQVDYRGIRWDYCSASQIREAAAMARKKKAAMAASGGPGASTQRGTRSSTEDIADSTTNAGRRRRGAGGGATESNCACSDVTDCDPVFHLKRRPWCAVVSATDGRGEHASASSTGFGSEGDGGVEELIKRGTSLKAATLVRDKEAKSTRAASFKARPLEVYTLDHKSSLRLGGAGGGLKTVSARGFTAALAPGFESEDASLDASFEYQRHALDGTRLVHPHLFKPGSCE